MDITDHETVESLSIDLIIAGRHYLISDRGLIIDMYKEMQVLDGNKDTFVPFQQIVQAEVEFKLENNDDSMMYTFLSINHDRYQIKFTYRKLIEQSIFVQRQLHNIYSGKGLDETFLSQDHKVMLSTIEEEVKRSLLNGDPFTAHSPAKIIDDHVNANSNVDSLSPLRDDKRSIIGDLKLIKQETQRLDYLKGGKFDPDMRPMLRIKWTLLKMHWTFNDDRYMRLARELESMLQLRSERPPAPPSRNVKKGDDIICTVKLLKQD